MSFISVSYAMVSALALSMGLLQLFLLRRTKRWRMEYALAGVMAFSSAVAALLELGLAKSQDPATAQILLFFLNIFIFGILVPMVWFVHVQLERDRIWLAQTITVMWGIGLIANIVLPGNLTFSSLESLQPNISFWGETWSQPVGTANPIRPLADLATFLIIVYVADASWRSFRSGQTRKALVIGVSVLFFILTAGVSTPLIDIGILSMPYMISWAFVAIALALGLEVAADAARSTTLSREIRESEARWRTLVENVELGVLGASAQGEIAYSNRFIENMLGYTRAQLRGRSIIDLAPQSLRRELSERILRAQKHGPRPQTTFPLLDSQGNVRSIRWSLVAARDHTDQITGFLAICEDVSALAKAESELKTSERAIERFNRAALLVEFASGLAHELNQPLAAILSNAQAGLRMLDADTASIDEIREILEDIASDDTRAGQVIHAMRRLLHRSEVEPVPLLVSELIDEVRGMIESDVQMADISFLTEIAEDLPKVHAGRVEIQQVLLNLVSNAVRVLKAEASEPSELTIAARRDDGRVFISVADTGPGLAADEVDRIFEAFYSTSTNGLGMGLSISRRIVELHGGKLACKSNPGEGATFEFSLPVYVEETESVDA